MGKGGATGGSVYNQSANMFGNAAGLYGAASGGYDPALSSNARNISSGINRYMNPYETNVIQGAQGDVQRMIDQQQAQNGAQAASVGAFGGSRQGIVEALTNSEGQRNLGQLAGNLRNTGWNTATGLAGQDIANLQQNRQFNAGVQNTASQFGGNQMMGAAAGMAGLGRTGFDIGQMIGGTQQQQGGLQQALAQQIMSLAGGQYDQFMGGPREQLSLMLSSLGMNPLNAATKTTGTSTPGFFDYLSLAGQTAGSIYGA